MHLLLVCAVSSFGWVVLPECHCSLCKWRYKHHLVRRWGQLLPDFFFSLHLFLFIWRFISPSAAASQPLTGRGSAATLMPIRLQLWHLCLLGTSIESRNGFYLGVPVICENTRLTWSQTGLNCLITANLKYIECWKWHILAGVFHEWMNEWIKK